MRFHTSLPVRHIGETIGFYEALFGAPPVKTKVDYAKFLPDEVQLNISFHEAPGQVDALKGVHLGLELASRDALERARARLEAAGLMPSRRETATCCYASQDKFWVQDPSGYRWELYYRIEDTEQKRDPALACC
jgi:catechol 2,3-dioxygenase-like lactoylglutathione lyase family enzyme